MQKNIRDNTLPNHDYFKSFKYYNKLINAEDAAFIILQKIIYRL